MIINFYFFAKLFKNLISSYNFIFRSKVYFLFHPFHISFSGEANLRSQKPRAFYRRIHRIKQENCYFLPCLVWKKKADRKKNASWHEKMWKEFSFIGQWRNQKEKKEEKFLSRQKLTSCYHPSYRLTWNDMNSQVEGNFKVFTLFFERRRK